MIRFLLKMVSILILIMIMAAIVMTGCASFFNPERKYESAVKGAPYDAIIVPGFPHQVNNWSMVSKCRVYWAVYLYQKGIAKNIIFSGSAVYTPYLEGEVMALYAEKMGVPSSHIFVETQAEHTAENLYYSCLLAKQQGFQSIAVASDVVQCQFLRQFKRKFNLNDITFIPIIYDDLELKEEADPKIDAHVAFVPDFISIKERDSFFMRYRCTHGYKIKKMIREHKDCVSDDPSVNNKASSQQSVLTHP